MRNRGCYILLFVLLFFTARTAYSDSIWIQLRTDGDAGMGGSRHLSDWFLFDLRDLINQQYEKNDTKIVLAFFRNNWGRPNIRFSVDRPNPGRKAQPAPEPAAWPLVAMGLGLVALHVKRARRAKPDVT